MSERRKGRDPAITSRIMSSVRSKDTAPEMMLRRELHARGLRYRLHTDLPGRPDIVFTRARLVVFVDGDFWHGHGWRARGFSSFEEQFASHRDPETWRSKIARNIERDQEVNAELGRRGWRVVRVLESQLRRDVQAVADDVADKVRQGDRERVARDRSPQH
jgi:DNA mismatch endonuclease (patch repair protein)